MEKIKEELKNAGFGIAFATQAEIKAGAACGMLSLVIQ